MRKKIITLLILVVFVCPGVGLANLGNMLESITVEVHSGIPEVVIKADEPIGYRYTVYEASNPQRVVVDFRNMDLAGNSIELFDVGGGIDRIVAKKYDLTSGKLCRVEIYTKNLDDFSVDVQSDVMRLPVIASGDVSEVSAVTNTEGVEGEEIRAFANSLTLAEPVSDDQSSLTTSVLVIGPQASEFPLVKPITNFKYFTLKQPTRLVLDVFDNEPLFSGKIFPLAGGFERIRVGKESTKTRFVFDARDERLPIYNIDEKHGLIRVSWDVSGGSGGSFSAPESGPVYIEALGFYQDQDSSVLSITTSGKADLVGPYAEGDKVVMILKDASIKNTLMRTIDTSSFPSAVKLVTPYIVQSGIITDVRFAIDVRGPVNFRTETVDGKVLLLVDDGPFRKNSDSPGSSDIVVLQNVLEQKQQMEVPATSVRSSAQFSSEMIAPGTSIEPQDIGLKAESIVNLENVETQQKEVVIEAEPAFFGQRISLVFDNADIHQILNLLADVSGLNIIAKREEVTGKLSIRLIDVPWDQAFAVVLDLMELEKIESSSVVRVLPREKARQIAESKWDEIKSKEEREELVDVIIPVSYSSLGDISSAIKKLSSPRGKITEDERSKQLIVTDIPSVVERIRGLVKTLDSPERQVMIEARIVEADSSFNRDLGVNWGYSKTDSTATGAQPTSLSAGLGGSFLIGLPAAGSVGGQGVGVGLRFGQIADSRVLDLRISALETAGRGRVVSSPRISTLNGKEAVISQGNEIPYATTDDSGNPTIAFKQATLELKVKPVINPDRSILLEINAKNDAVGQSYGDAGPAINTKQAKTNVLLHDGDTTVIGGIFVESETESETGVPLLMRIPILRHLFKSTNNFSRRNELLIFITPRILD